MTHRAQQIFDQVKAAVVANGHWGDRVYAQRALSLSEQDIELPALCVFVGEDAPEDADLNSYGSVLECIFTAYVREDSEADVLAALIEARRQVHRAVNGYAPLLTLSFANRLSYGGADEPELAAGERIDGAQESRWLVPYSMNISDPQ